MQIMHGLSQIENPLRYYMFLGENLMTWRSKKQNVM